MTDVKWVKLKVGMFDGASFKRIKKAKIGGESFRDKLTAVWFELLDFAGKCNHSGAFIDSHEIPFTDLDDIATMIDREPEELKLCMSFYIREGMVEIIDDIYLLSNWTQYQNEDGLAKIREQKRVSQAKWRAKKKALTAGNPENSEEMEDIPENVDVVDADVESTEHLPSYSISTSTSTSISYDLEDIKKEDIKKENVKKEEKKGRKKSEPKPVVQPPVDFSTTNFSPAMVSTVESWLRYKSERREAYKPTGLQSLMTKIQNEVNLHGERAVIGAITDSMAANYQGIVWDKVKNHKGGTQAQYQGNRGGCGRNVQPSGVDRLLEMIDRGDFDE